MRLAVLDTGHDRPAALALRLMARLTRSDPPEIVRLGCYRHRFFGTPFFDLVQELMRGRSSWTVGERELFAAYVSKTNECPFCATGHRAIAVSYVGPVPVNAALDRASSAPLRAEVRAVLAFLDKMSRQSEALTGADVQAVRDAGVIDEALNEAILIGTLFHVINRVMNAVGAGPLDGHRRDVAVRMVRRFGYRNPLVVRLLSRAG
ncbi:MAG: carboxymuconolactone decarboxylase family protein [Pseudonocardiaceae bacterium]